MINWTTGSALPSTAPKFDLADFTSEVRVVSCHDGDTLKVLAPIPWAGGTVRLVTVRLLGLDTPEISTKNLDEKHHAVLARDFVLRLLSTIFSQPMRDPRDIEDALSKNVVTATATFHGADKYGRTLATLVTTDGIDVNRRLIEDHYAVKYDGGHKATYTQGPGAAVTHTPGAVTHTPGAVTHTPGAAVTHTPGAVTNTPGAVTNTPGAVTNTPGDDRS
jgi:endonuclease YncB( thermonuclease family)